MSEGRLFQRNRTQWEKAQQPADFFYELWAQKDTLNPECVKPFSTIEEHFKI